MKYLYGAAVQGIQDFIFRTNELRDIMGASELVESICTCTFSEMLKKENIEGEMIINAAGNIKCIFHTKEDCAVAVRDFPRKVMTMAPGITISQAVVEYDSDFGKCISELEAKLRAERNRLLPNTQMLSLGMKHAQKTGLPAIQVDDEENADYGTEVIDASTQAKREYNKVMKLCQKSFGRKDIEHYNIAYNISDISGINSWIAVVHADGNSLGQVVRHIGRDREKYKQFSQLLNTAAIKAANDAYLSVSQIVKESVVIPIRPVVLGGDDMTVIIRGDIAVPYTKVFMQRFEEYTGSGEMRELLSEVFPKAPKLTACAGIAFIKESYPFYYGYRLSEELCTHAKNVTKHNAEDGKPAAACIMMHKVQDSFVRDYKQITKRELNPYEGLSLQYGPYFLHRDDCYDGYTDIDQLESWSNELDSDGERGNKNGIRQWLSMLYGNKGKAHQRLERLKDISGGSKLVDKLTDPQSRKGGIKVVPAYDVLAYHAITSRK